MQLSESALSGMADAPSTGPKLVIQPVDQQLDDGLSTSSAPPQENKKRDLCCEDSDAVGSDPLGLFAGDVKTQLDKINTGLSDNKENDYKQERNTREKMYGSEPVTDMTGSIMSSIIVLNFSCGT